MLSNAEDSVRENNQVQAATGQPLPSRQDNLALIPPSMSNVTLQVQLPPASYGFSIGQPAIVYVQNLYMFSQN